MLQGMGVRIASGVFILLMLASAPAGGQEPGIELESIDRYQERMLTDQRTAEERPYFAETEEALRSIDLGQYVPRDEQGREREVLILVWEGERIFCAHCGTLLRSTTQFQHVTMEQSVNYYDDGTHGDLIANDGLPSKVKDIDNDYIGPRCYQHMVYLEGLRERAQYRDAHRAAFLRTMPMDPEEPQTFYAMVNVAPLDSESRLALDPMAGIMPGTPGVEDQYSYMTLEQLRKRQVNEFEEAVVNEFKRKPWHTYYYLHRDEINPFVPQVTTQAPTSMLLGPQFPQTRTQMLMNQARGFAQQPEVY